MGEAKDKCMLRRCYMHYAQFYYCEDLKGATTEEILERVETVLSQHKCPCERVPRSKHNYFIVEDVHGKRHEIYGD